jgi:hypothetical protein
MRGERSADAMDDCGLSDIDGEVGMDDVAGVEEEE